MDTYIYIACLRQVVAFAPKVIKCAYGAIKGNKMRRLRRRTRKGCGFSSLVKQNKKGKNCAVFCFAGKRKLLYLYLRCDYMGEKKKSLPIVLLAWGENTQVDRELSTQIHSRGSRKRGSVRP